MSKMGQELEKRLDENKYELYEALKKAHTLITSIIPNDLVSESAKHTMQKLIVKILAKVES